MGNLIAKVPMSRNRMFLLSIQMTSRSVSRLATKAYFGFDIYVLGISTLTVSNCYPKGDDEMIAFNQST